MLTYLILTTRQILMEAVILGVFTGYVMIAAAKAHRRIVWSFALAGVGGSIAVAVIRNMTSMIDTAILNGWIYVIGLIAYVLFLIFTIKKPSDHGFLSFLPWIFAGVLYVTILVYALPDVKWLEDDSQAVSSGQKAVALYCTHSDESYEPSDGDSSLTPRGGIYDVAESLKKGLPD